MSPIGGTGETLLTSVVLLTRGLAVEQEGVTLAAATTQRDGRGASAAFLELVARCHNQAGAARAERMA